MAITRNRFVTTMVVALACVTSISAQQAKPAKPNFSGTWAPVTPAARPFQVPQLLVITQDDTTLTLSYQFPTFSAGGTPIALPATNYTLDGIERRVTVGQRNLGISRDLIVKAAWSGDVLKLSDRPVAREGRADGGMDQALSLAADGQLVIDVSGLTDNLQAEPVRYLYRRVK